MYPQNYDMQKALPLQSYLFGHRVQPSQTKYEYLIEFLQVALADKKNAITEKPYRDEMFPVDNDQLNGNIVYYPKTRMEKYCGCVGIRTLSAATSAFTVRTLRDGAQSIRMKS